MLKGKTAVITGGSRGIGEAIAYKLASLGANIAIIYAGNTAAAENVCSICRREYGADARFYQCNVADFVAVKETVAKIKADFGTAQILINNAGI
ncbi:MAG: SDR family NAD(P)-dependent oxidoreductase, partial [Ruminococcaceae bacterium]|nr:SDR family NAD(P)-dependent oxidoreductase [Oscillospiraceae bacterium]